jgi:hypothetical protein
LLITGLITAMASGAGKAPIGASATDCASRAFPSQGSPSGPRCRRGARRQVTSHALQLQVGRRARGEDRPGTSSCRCDLAASPQRAVRQTQDLEGGQSSGQASADRASGEAQSGSSTSRPPQARR